jgi:hypothetical protein
LFAVVYSSLLQSEICSTEK